MYEFEILQPTSLIHALELKAEYGADLHPLAGGTDILVSVRNNRVDWGDSPILLDLNRLISDLKFIKKASGSIEIGSLMTHTEIIENQIIQNDIPALTKSLSLIGSPQIRNRGTMIGNMVHASPAADSLPILYTRDSKVEIMSLKTTKLIPISDFIKGPGIVNLDPNAIVTKVVIPELPNYVSDYLSLRQRRSLSCNVISVGVEMQMNDTNNGIEDIRIAYILIEAERLIQTECVPITDVRSNMDYRRAMTGILLKRFLQSHFKMT
ncbi:MAG: FAD binding domain-containing protein [Candidatus Hodarchaeales archaeon]|jgi:CO/xanthine dehydrogenase FAD-binding subunit